MCVDTYKRLMSMKNRKLSFLFIQLLFFVSLTSMAQPGSVKKVLHLRLMGVSLHQPMVSLSVLMVWRLGLGNPL